MRRDDGARRWRGAWEEAAGNEGGACDGDREKEKWLMEGRWTRWRACMPAATMDCKLGEREGEERASRWWEGRDESDL